MRRIFCLIPIIIAVSVGTAIGQDEGTQRMRKALEGRMMLVKLDLPAVDTGINLFLDNLDVSYDAASCNGLIKEYGVAIKKGTRSKITGVRVSTKGIELDLDGGGMAGRDWIVGGFRLTEPEPLPRSDREVELERQSQTEQNPSLVNYVRSELDYERQRRIAQDERNRESYKRIEGLRSQYIEENRKNWGSKVIIVVRSRKQTITMRDMVTALGKYVELLPIEKPAK